MIINGQNVEWVVTDDGQTASMTMVIVLPPETKFERILNRLLKVYADLWRELA